MWRRSQLTVVLPFVPVTAITVSEREGWPQNVLMTVPRPTPLLGTMTCVAPVTDRPGMLITAVAPRPIASATSSLPPGRGAGKYTNRLPGLAAGASATTDDTSCSRSPETVLVGSSRKSSARITRCLLPSRGSATECHLHTVAARSAMPLYVG